MDATGPERAQVYDHGLYSLPIETQGYKAATDSTISYLNPQPPRFDIQEKELSGSKDQSPGVLESTRRQDNKKAGLRPLTFWLVIVLIGLIVIAASVGGAVGSTRKPSGSRTTSVLFPSLLSSSMPLTSLYVERF